jgi:hypothetical protein
MPSQAELDAQNNASRARQQARRGIEQPAPQMQQPYVNPYGQQYGTDSIQDQDYYDTYYADSGNGYYDYNGDWQSGYYDDEDEDMTEEAWEAYLAGLEEGQSSQEEPSYYSDYGSRMPDGPIDYAPNAPVGRLPVEEEFQPTGGGGFSYAPNVPIPSDRYPSFIPSKEEVIGTASNIYQGFKNQFGTPGYKLSSPGYSQQEPEAETPFLQYLQENTQQPQGGGANQMEQGESNEYGNSPQRNYYDFVQGGGQMNDEQLRQANEMARSMGTTFDPETGYSRQPYQDYQEQGPQVQAPMSMSDTRGMLQERFGSPTVYDQSDRSFYDDESILRDQRQAARPDFGKSYRSTEDDRITRDIDKYDNRRTFEEARRLVPTQRDKTGKIINKAEQRAAMTLTDREVQDKKRDEYNEEYRERNLERLQQTIDNGNKPNASKLEKKKGEVAEEILLVQETYENYQPWMGQAIEADRMNIVPAPSGFDSHLDFAAFQNNFDLDELYETINQKNNEGGGAAPVQPRPTSPAATSKGMKKPTQEAINALKSNPSRASEFDQYYGQGSSAQFL